MAILVSKRMARTLPRNAPHGLERSCDWIRTAPAGPGLERIEAWFAGRAYDPHRHDTYAIGYTLEGVQSFDYRGARADSLPGNVIVLHPDELHDGRAGTERGFRYRMLYIEPRLVREALGSRARSLPFVRSAVTSDQRLLAAVMPPLAELDRPLELLEREQAVLAIADALLQLDPTAQGRRPGNAIARTAVLRARDFLDAEFARTVAAEELERLTGLDRYELARHFRSQFGTSPYRYLTMRRLDHVRAALAAGQSLAAAALAAGFADQSHMTRRFKRAYGVSPGRWRALQAAWRRISR